MSRQRKPTNVLERAGAFRRNPQRKRSGEPVDNAPFPKSPPKHFDKKTQAAWREIVAIAPAGVLKRSDKIIVEICASLYAEFSADPIGMSAPRLVQLRIALGAIGCTPADKAKLHVDKPPVNPFDSV